MAEVCLELSPFLLMACEILWHMATPPILKINNGTPVFSIYPVVKKEDTREDYKRRRTTEKSTTEKTFEEKG